MVRVLNYRPPSKAPDTVELWWEKASCQSLPAEDFEPTFGVGSREEVIKANEDKFERARRACSSCLIWHMCYQKAGPDDFFYTMRAGVEPAQFTLYKERGRIVERQSQMASDKLRCPEGHSNWKIWGKKRPRRKCVDCSYESNAKSRANVKAKKKGIGVVQ
jgi:hypothetical protein